MNNQDPQNPENRPGNPGMCSSSSGSDDGNNSSNDSDEAEGQQRQEELQLLQHQQQHLKKPAAAATSVNTTYKDYSRVPPDAPSDAPPATLVAAAGGQPQQARKEPTFVVKVHMILNNKKFESIITWLPHGRSWRILRPKEFEEEVIPLYFRHGRYASFMRQVNGWGFRRVTGGSDYNSYYHELFLRGLPHLCGKMRRLTNKDVSNRKKEEEEPTPDFYKISRENPLPENSPADMSVPIPTLVPPAFAAPVPSQTPISACISGGNGADNEVATLDKRRTDILQQLNHATAQQHQPQEAAAPSMPMEDLLQHLMSQVQQQQPQAPPPPSIPAPVPSAASSSNNWMSMFNPPAVAAAPPPPPPQVPQGDPNALLLQLGLSIMLSQQQQAPPPAPQAMQANQLLQLMQSLGNGGGGAASQAPPAPPPSAPTDLSMVSSNPALAAAMLWQQMQNNEGNQ